MKKTMPVRRWAQAMRLLFRRYFRHEVGRSAAALTYYLVFAAFPFLVFLRSLLTVLGTEAESILHELGRFLPEDVQRLARSYLAYVSRSGSGRLLWVSLIFTVWFPMRATLCLLDAICRAFGVPQRRGLRQQGRTLLFTLWLVATLVAAAVLIALGRQVLQYLMGKGLVSRQMAEIWNVLRFFLLALVLFAALAVLYMLALGQRKPLREVAAGVSFSLAAWLGVSVAFSSYVEHLADYTRLYGSVSAVVVTLLWLYISATVLIMGAELNAVLRHCSAGCDRGRNEEI
ncbi:MAG: YihY/virulence factor BrkB family protein [Oscillospiraceae bacterium]|nr:YihY/virulence factor BrkB family protein [Oscillospiraceae bacterium]